MLSCKFGERPDFYRKGVLPDNDSFHTYYISLLAIPSNYCITYLLDSDPKQFNKTMKFYYWHPLKPLWDVLWDAQLTKM